MAESIPLFGTPCKIDASDEGKGIAKEYPIGAGTILVSSLVVQSSKPTGRFLGAAIVPSPACWVSVGGAIRGSNSVVISADPALVRRDVRHFFGRVLCSNRKPM